MPDLFGPAMSRHGLVLAIAQHRQRHDPEQEAATQQRMLDAGAEHGGRTGTRVNRWADVGNKNVLGAVDNPILTMLGLRWKQHVEIGHGRLYAGWGSAPGGEPEACHCSTTITQ